MWLLPLHLSAWLVLVQRPAFNPIFLTWRKKGYFISSFWCKILLVFFFLIFLQFYLNIEVKRQLFIWYGKMASVHHGCWIRRVPNSSHSCFLTIYYLTFLLCHRFRTPPYCFNVTSSKKKKRIDKVVLQVRSLIKHVNNFWCCWLKRERESEDSESFLCLLCPFFMLV